MMTVRVHLCGEVHSLEQRRQLQIWAGHGGVGTGGRGLALGNRWNDTCGQSRPVGTRGKRHGRTRGQQWPCRKTQPLRRNRGPLQGCGEENEARSVRFFRNKSIKSRGARLAIADSEKGTTYRSACASPVPHALRKPTSHPEPRPSRCLSEHDCDAHRSLRKLKRQ